ncbi:MAG: hypothetical protein GXC94_02215 [Comamonadaceae bacterium]|nr:hypothetical protein [Comamonadaceae bacterium]
MTKAIAAVAFVTTILAAIAGWFINLFGLIKLALAGSFTPMFLVKLVGVIVAPLGSILGLFF